MRDIDALTVQVWEVLCFSVRHPLIGGSISQYSASARPLHNLLKAFHRRL